MANILKPLKTGVGPGGLQPLQQVPEVGDQLQDVGLDQHRQLGDEVVVGDLEQLEENDEAGATLQYILNTLRLKSKI